MIEDVIEHTPPTIERRIKNLEEYIGTLKHEIARVDLSILELKETIEELESKIWG